MSPPESEMEDPADRLSTLVAALSADPGYATGPRPFPHPVSGDDAVAIAEGLADEFDHGVQRRAELAAAQGLRIYCRPGCTACCTIAVMVYYPDALRIARYLREPEQADARAAFLAAYDAWRQGVGDAPERLTALFAQGAQAEYDALHQELWRRGTLCAFNHQGRCVIYPVRPLSCRNAHALDTDAYCRPEAGRPAAALSFVPLDRFLQGATRLLRATHNAATDRRHQQEAVCAAVHRLLQE